MPPKPPLCPAYSASQNLTLTTIPEDLYSPLRPHEQAVFDNFAWSTAFSPPLPSITNFSLPSSRQPSRLSNLALQFKKFDTVKRPSPPPYLPVLSKEGNGLGFVFSEMLDNQRLATISGEGVTDRYAVDDDDIPLQNWLQDRMEAEQTREDFEKEACAATEALKETDTGPERIVIEQSQPPNTASNLTDQARANMSPGTPKNVSRKVSSADAAGAAQSSPRNNIFSPTGRILGISATLFAPTIGKRKSGTMAERNRHSFETKRMRRSSLSSLSITQLDKVTPLFASAVLHGSPGSYPTPSDSCETSASSLVPRRDALEGKTRPTESLSRKRSLRRTVSSFFLS